MSLGFTPMFHGQRSAGAGDAETAEARSLSSASPGAVVTIWARDRVLPRPVRRANSSSTSVVRFAAHDFISFGASSREVDQLVVRCSTSRSLASARSPSSPSSSCRSSVASARPPRTLADGSSFFLSYCASQT